MYQQLRFLLIALPVYYTGCLPNKAAKCARVCGHFGLLLGRLDAVTTILLGSASIFRNETAAIWPVPVPISSPAIIASRFTCDWPYCALCLPPMKKPFMPIAHEEWYYSSKTHQRGCDVRVRLSAVSIKVPVGFQEIQSGSLWRYTLLHVVPPRWDAM